MMRHGNQREQQAFSNMSNMKYWSFYLAFIMLLFAGSCNYTQYVTVHYKPSSNKEGYTLSIPKNFQRTCLLAQNDYCYMFTYKNDDSSSATIYIHYFPMSFLVDEVPYLVRLFYGDSIFCKYYDAELDEEDTLKLQPFCNGQVIDNVFHSLENIDTLILGGRDDVYAWKEIRIKNRIVVGYYNVPVQKCELFNRALFSLQSFDTTQAVDDYRKEMGF